MSTKTEVISVTSANICHLPLRRSWQVQARIAQAMKHGGPTSAVVGQEIEDSNYWRIWRSTARATGRDTFGSPHECPVSIPEAWRGEKGGHVESHGGLHLVSPDRGWGWATGTTPNGFRIAVLGCHTVSKPRKGVDHAAWRIEHWREYLDELAAQIARSHSLGYSVFWAGDFNSTSLPSLAKGERHLARSGYDYVRMLPAQGVRVAAVHPARISGKSRLLGMDHPLVTGSVTLERKTA